MPDIRQNCSKLSARAPNASSTSEGPLGAVARARGDDVPPFYRFELTPDDLVIVRPRKAPAARLTASIKLPKWAEDKAREIARDKGWDYQVLRSNWLAFAESETANGNGPKNAGAASVGYRKAQNALC